MKHEIKIRKSWGQLNPMTRIHGTGKTNGKPKWSKRDRSDWKRDL